MKEPRCDRSWEIDPLREGRLGAKDAEAFERHARTCEACARVIARNERLRQLAASAPTDEPNDLALRRTRARVLHDVARGAPFRRSLRAPLVAALAVVLLALVSGTAFRTRPRAEGSPSSSVTAPPSPAPSAPRDAVSAPFASVILKAEGARWSRTREGSTERVRLAEGTLEVNVRHQLSGERFLVDLPDGELEVRGTTFEVSVKGAATTHVAVDEGSVALRLNGLAEILLAAGEGWSAPVLEESKTPSAARTRPAPVRRVAHAPSAPAPVSTISPVASALDASISSEEEPAAYAAAIALLQGGQYPSAASAFRAFVLAHPQAPQTEDASFLEAAALARAGRPDAAALAAEDHLARFPRSFHRLEAAILIARAARDRGDCAEARAILAPWLGSHPDEEARATLQKCAEGTPNEK